MCLRTCPDCWRISDVYGRLGRCPVCRLDRYRRVQALRNARRRRGELVLFVVGAVLALVYVLAAMAMGRAI